MTIPTKTCCDQAMQPIRLVDATSIGSDFAGVGHVDLAYAAADEQATWMTGRVPTMGAVYGVICPACGRIELYGVPRGTFATGARKHDEPRIVAPPSDG